jgi:chromosome segregation ATPase
MGIRRMAWSTSVLCLALLTCSSAWSQAAATASREREALRRVQRELQQNRQELAELKEKSAVLDKEKAGLASDNRRLAAQVGRALARVRAEESKGQALSASLEAAASRERAAWGQERLALQGQVRGLEQQLASAAASASARAASLERDLQQAAAQKNQLDSTLAGVRQEFAGSRQAEALCQDKNTQLYKVGIDLIAQCRDRSAVDTVLRLEPFTGLKRVEIENMLEKTRDSLETHRQRP